MGDSVTQPHTAEQISTSVAVSVGSKPQPNPSRGGRARLSTPYMTVENGKRLRALNRTMYSGFRVGRAINIFDSIHDASQ
jgi:hypothetical protein